jgi:signal transduction histidine kinase
MRLADFILANIEPILQAWEKFARSLAPGAEMEVLALRDDAEAILRASVRDMHTAQTVSQQADKSKGRGGAGGAASDRLDDPSSVHGVERVASGFSLAQVVSEYRALRASVLGLWRESAPDPDIKDLGDITRFNEAIDQSLAMAIASYMDRVDRSREMFLAILGHDLRNPLNSISMSAQLASMQIEMDPESREALSQIVSSVKAMSGLISDLIDFASTRLGTGMPLVMSSVNLEVLGSEVLDELKAAHPNRTFRFETGGDLKCSCDGARLRQVISNLLGNALEHGSKEDDIELSLASEGQDITLKVRNQGSPIAPDLLPTIFDPLVRNTSEEAQLRRRPGSVGLGLYIAHEIVTAHGGTIDVTSSVESGTVFTVRSPRHPYKH